MSEPPPRSRRPALLGIAFAAAALIPAHADSPAYLGMPSAPIFARSGAWTTEPAFPNVTFRNPVFLEPEPGTKRLFVGELEGRIYALDGANPDTSDKKLILDISEHTQGGWDCGMMGLAFHPEYGRAGSANRGFIYIAYSWADQPVVHGRPASDFLTWSRLSRFKVDPATGVADPASELVLINQRDRFIIHVGGGMFFHPRDGFLYLSVGDEGGTASAENVQRVDRSLFSGVLRIDVDQRGGNISHPIRRQPANGQTAHYFIPNDNPFVDTPGALGEFFAIGLRSPHRMTYDPVDNLAWIGEIGASAVEEICVLEFNRGAMNFQWNILEGRQPGPGPTDRAPVPGVWTDAIFELGRDQARSIIGGYVYRGARHPALQGKYICGDFSTGRLWALSYTKESPPRLVRADVLGDLSGTNYNYRGSEGGLSSFGRSHDGELYLLMHGFYTRIARLARSEPRASNLPALLSQTGVFSDVKKLVPAAGLLPYAVNLPHWTDGIPAQRWISVPTGKKIGIGREGRWAVPPGTVLVQHFEVPASESADGRAKRLETRLLVAAADGTFYGAGYRWKADQSDADLVSADSSRTLSLRAAEEGQIREMNWNFSSPQKCMECHTPGAGYALGLKTRQLHRDMAAPGGGTGEQLRTWEQLGFFEAQASREILAQRDRFVPPAESKASVEQRVRSYLDVNCAHCHGNSPVRAAWDGSFSTPLAQQRLIFGPIVGEHATGDYHVIAPKDVPGSVLYRRGTSRDMIERMPPLGQSRPDPQFVALLREWIEQMPREERNPPKLVRARRQGATTIHVVFSEAVQKGQSSAGAERAASYALDGGAKIVAAQLAEDLRTVVLTTTPLESGQSYQLSVGGVADRADKPNAMASGAVILIR